MEIIECSQGSPEWIAARAGVATASMFSMIRSKVGMLTEQQTLFIQYASETGNTDLKASAIKAGYRAIPTAKAVQQALAGEPVGDWSDAAKNYAFRLACERIAGAPLNDDTFETYAMRRGRELEEECRRRHEAHIKQIVDLAGFIKTDDGKFGCSADSLIEPDGGAEYKAFYAPEKTRPILIDNDWGDIMDQVQGCMWITGRKWWDMCLLFPALDCIGRGFTRCRVMRDDNYIEALESDLVAFDALVEECRAQLLQTTKEAA